MEGLGRASQPDGPRPRPARGGARGSGRRTGCRLTHLGCQSFQLRGYLVPPPPPLLSRDPGALRLITFPDTTWPSAAAQRSASRRPNRPPPTLRSRPGLRRKPKKRRRRRRRRQRAGEADGRSGFRLSPQRRTRREWRRKGETEEGEATSLPGPRAARDAGTQEEEDGEEEAVAAAPHAHTATASPPPGSARRAAAAARHAGSEGRCRRPPGQERGGAGYGGGAVHGGGAGYGGRGREGAASGSPSRARSSPPLPADRAKVSAPPRGIMGEGISATTPTRTPSQMLSRKHQTREGWAVRCKQASNKGPGVPFARALTATRAHTQASL